MSAFQLISKNKPAGDQPKAIKELTEGIKKGYGHQTLLGVTGSGKTFTVANLIQNIGKPTLVIAHNKTLAAQLTNEFRELFPNNSVNYFVSYYDYYQPEAYIPSSDTYIGKEAMINEEIDKLRHAATTSLLTRKDVIVVASVSCIYGLGAPEVYKENIFHLKKGGKLERNEFVRKLVSLQYNRTNTDLTRGTFRIRGENWEIMPPDKERVYRFVVEDGKIKKIYDVLPAEGVRLGITPEPSEVFIAPAKHFITPVSDRVRAIKAIQKELKERLNYFEKNGLLLEAERLERRTKYDVAMMKEVGYCNGIENYSRHLSGRSAGAPPDTLLNYFPRQNTKSDLGGQAHQTKGNSGGQAHQTKGNSGGQAHQTKGNSGGQADFLTIIDESHVTVPQIQGMHAGDASRKKTLIEYGFRLPSAADNRPLTFEEFEKRVGQIVFTSATPSVYEKKKSKQVVEQIIRPTGLVDPKITIRPVLGQIDDLIPRIEARVNPISGKEKERVLVTTLTKRMAEDLAGYLEEKGIKVTYLHSDVKTLERIKILTRLRKGEIDVLVGVNLLREGLDLPEVSLVAILDADKEGFLRSETALVQTIGRAARNVRGEVVMYADSITGSIERAMRETERRRKIQLAYNKKHNITPTTIVKEIRDILPVDDILKLEMKPVPKSKRQREALIREKESEMKRASDALDFELAAILRDELRILKKEK